MRHEHETTSIRTALSVGGYIHTWWIYKYLFSYYFLFSDPSNSRVFSSPGLDKWRNNSYNTSDPLSRHKSASKKSFLCPIENNFIFFILTHKFTSSGPFQCHHDCVFILSCTAVFRVQPCKTHKSVSPRNRIRKGCSDLHVTSRKGPCKSVKTKYCLYDT